jgi:hypothetical protein
MRWGAYARYRSMTERRIDGFLYGLFMDVDVLRNSGVAPADPATRMLTISRSVSASVPHSSLPPALVHTEC